ncbi:MAG: DUF6340 family protein [Paludibacteraceae bacterium]
MDKIRILDNLSEYYVDYDGFYNELDVKVQTNWSLYYPDKNANILQFVDSFLWQSNNLERKIAHERIPKRYDALVDACILTGSNTADRMTPRWEKEDRYFFSSKDKIMQQAMDSVPYRKWEAAIKLWKKAAELTKSNKTKYQAYDNIAVAYEIVGDMPKALTYIEKALREFTNQLYASEEDGYLLIDYRRNVPKRNEEYKLLKQQLGN